MFPSTFTVPDPPTALIESSLSSTSMTISWIPPANNGGSPITGYPIWWDKGIGHWEVFDADNTGTS